MFFFIMLSVKKSFFVKGSLDSQGIVFTRFNIIICIGKLVLSIASRLYELHYMLITIFVCLLSEDLLTSARIV